MSAYSNGLRRLQCRAHLRRAQWPQPAIRGPSSQPAIRTLTTNTEASIEPVESKETAITKAFPIPFRNAQHARAVPTSPSYFSREPKFNDLYTRMSNLLTQYHHLPTLPPTEAPAMTFAKLPEMRDRLGEPIKASHYSKVLQVVKRLNLIEPSILPEKVKMALAEFRREVVPMTQAPKAITVDKYGRALGVGKRKESTARAWVVEGTGEVLINGKTLSEAFGRVHDRESAVWALQATQRLDKYNVWALVEGGGTTGQAEAITLAVAKALLAHEPALKPALRKAGCVTRDPRAVERKHHGHLKARKKPAWVKR